MKRILKVNRFSVGSVLVSAFVLEQASATYGTRAIRGTWTIFNGTLSELKYSNYDFIKILNL